MLRVSFVIRSTEIHPAFFGLLPLCMLNCRCATGICCLDHLLYFLHVCVSFPLFLSSSLMFVVLPFSLRKCLRIISSISLMSASILLCPIFRSMTAGIKIHGARVHGVEVGLWSLALRSGRVKQSLRTIND